MIDSGPGLAVRAAPPVKRCDVCGAPDALGLGTCVACGVGSPDALVFIERSTRRADRRGLETWLLDASHGVVGPREARDVAEGCRPVVGLPGPAAARAAGALGERGVSAAVVPRARAWSRVPVSFVALLGVVVGTGVFAAAAAGPWLAVLAVLFATLLGLAAHRRVREPVWAPPAGDALGLPRLAEREVRATLLRLDDGRARGFLQDLAAVSASLVRSPAAGPDADVGRGVEELLHLACDAALDLDQLDASLGVLERRGGVESTGELADAFRRAAATRDALVGRFEEALAALGRLHAASVDAPKRLTELAQRLAEDARHRAEAWEEVRRLVS